MGPSLFFLLDVVLSVDVKDGGNHDHQVFNVRNAM